MEWIYNHTYNLLCGILLATIGYFNEIQGAVHVMWAALAFDLIIGIMNSLIIDKDKFSMSKAFIAIWRAIGATVIVGLLYAMDKEMHQEFVKTYNGAAWLIAGFYVWSASENMDSLTGGKIFGVLSRFIEKRVEETSGIDLKDTKIHEHHE